MIYADVVVELPVPKVLTYSVPESLTSQVTEGRAVMVPLRTGRARGYVVSIHNRSPLEGIKPVSHVIDEIPILPRELLDTAREIAEHYLYTWGDALKAAVLVPAAKGVRRLSITERGLMHLTSSKEEGLPEKALKLLHKEDELSTAQLERRLREKGLSALLKEMRKKGWVKYSLAERQAGKRGDKDEALSLSHTRPLKNAHLDSAHERRLPDAETEQAWAGLLKTLSSKEGRPLLMQSGCQELREGVYLLAADNVIKSGKSVIILKPQIDASRPFINRLRAHFKEALSVTHSGLTEAGRWEQWKRVARGEASVVVGARASVLTAVKNLGLIIVDEEESESYKQEEIPRYHAREVALIRGRTAGCDVLLGSSAPSMESLYLIEGGKMGHVVLQGNGGLTKPAIEIVDLKLERRRGTISPLLRERIREALKNGGQALLFLNRRGYSNFVQCRECGFVLRCPRCDISLTYHTQWNRVRCRFCRYEEPTHITCPSCQGSKIWYLGMGTQKVEREVRRLFPQASVCRLDSDIVKGRDELFALVEKIEKGEFQLIVCTQMGLPYLSMDNFGLAAIICADTVLNLPDFRSAEKSFRLVCQLACKLTGSNGPRRVLIQSFNPEHYSLVYSQGLDYAGFYEEELQRRIKLGYPPISRMVSVRVEGAHCSGAGPLAASISGALRSRVPENSDICIMGPTAVHLARVHARTRWQILIKGSEEKAVEELAKYVVSEYGHRGRRTGQIKVSIDVDPVVFF